MPPLNNEPRAVIITRLPQSLLDALDRKVAATGSSREAAIRKAIAVWADYDYEEEHGNRVHTPETAHKLRLEQYRRYNSKRKENKTNAKEV